MATEKKGYYLYPGGIFADRTPHRVTTVLGSCVAVTVFDPSAGLGGMNHFLLPLWNAEGLPTPRYGNVAMDTLIRRVVALGGDESRLQAKIFGGASSFTEGSGFLSVGERNVELAVRMLVERRIRILTADVGGRTGRHLVFDSASGEVLLRRLPPRNAPEVTRPAARETSLYLQ